MNYNEAKYRFIQEWGVLGSSWGINRAMAQIQALLLLSPTSLTTDDIMEELKMSRGNVNMNIRALMDWGLVYKEYKPGERKEFFYTEKDVWKITKQVAQERRKREILPVKQMLDDMVVLKLGETDNEKELIKVSTEFKWLVDKMDGALQKMENRDKNWFMKFILKLL